MLDPNLIHIGVKGGVIALSRFTGEEVWRTKLKGWGFVNVHYVGEDLLAATRGEIYCLDPNTGQLRWTNELPGMGFGLICVAGSPNNLAAVEMMMEQEQANNGAAAGSTAAT